MIASVVTLVDAAVKVLHLLENARARLHPHAELFAIINTVCHTYNLVEDKLRKTGDRSTSDLDGGA